MISMVSSRMPPSLVTLLVLLGSENEELLKTEGRGTSRPAPVQTTSSVDSSQLGLRSTRPQDTAESERTHHEVHSYKMHHFKGSVPSLSLPQPQTAP